jgi:RimK family alpha-L-glutamate ligase
MKNKKILILTGGEVSKLSSFSKEGAELGINLTVAPFSDLEYDFKSTDKKFVVRIGNIDLADFDVIYFRLLGKRIEDAAIVSDYAKNNRIKIVDRIYQRPQFLKVPIPKGLETKLLFDKGIPFPRTLLLSLSQIQKLAPKDLGFPFVIKGTNGKRGRAVWSPENKSDLAKLIKELKPREVLEERFLAQEFIKSSIRIRVFVINGKSRAAIVRPQRWSTRFDKEPAEKTFFQKVPSKYSCIAEKAAKSLFVDIAGVDILETEDKKLYLLEVNSAPRWDSIKKDTGLNVEREILKYLIKL